MSKKNIGNLFAETLIGKKIRLQDCCNRSNEVYTIDHVQFGGYDTDIDDSDPGVEIRLFCKPLDPNQPKLIPVFMFGLEDEIEFIEEGLSVENRIEFQRRFGE